MRQLHLHGSIVKKKRLPPIHIPNGDNRLNRAFKTTTENVAWVSDITYIATFRRVAIFNHIDLFDRKVIGWALILQHYEIQRNSYTCIKMAKLNRPINNNQPLIFHSDRGIQ